jgi:hypothetical protein
MNDLNTLILIDNTDKPEQVTFGSLPVNSVFKAGGSVYLKIENYSRTSALHLKTGYANVVSDCQLVFPLKATLTIEKA